MASTTLSLSVVCRSNINRSIEVHDLLRKKGYSVRSFGTGHQVKLPGPNPNHCMIYDFTTTYKQMYDDLLKKGEEFFTQNGILHLLGRNQRIKLQPEKFQECANTFDLIFTCEVKVYDRVVEYLCSKDEVTLQAVHVINVEIEDTQEDVTLGAFFICELCQCTIKCADDMEDSLSELLLNFEEKTGKSFLHTICFYKRSWLTWDASSNKYFCINFYYSIFSLKSFPS